MNSMTYTRPNYCNPNMDITYETVENAADIEQLYMNPNFPMTKYVMPYLDHCYAAELPTVPADSRVDSPPLPLAEPLAAYVDIVDVGMASLRNQIALGLNNQRNIMSLPNNNNLCRQGGNGNNTCNAITNVINSNNNNNNNNVNGSGDGEVDPYEGSVTRCICDFQHDDGYMICCDRCGVWQHVDCMGVDRKRIPDSYLCELCYPRQVDKRRAVRIQSKKKEEFEMDESSGSGDDSVEEERKPKKRRRKKDQSKRKNSATEVVGGQVRKQRKRTSSELEKPNHKTNIDQKRSRQQHFSNSNTSDSDNNTGGGDVWGLTSKGPSDVLYNTNINPPAVECRNTYSPEVLSILMLKVKSMGANNNSSNTLAIVREQLSKRCYRIVTYEDNSKGLESVDNIKVNQAVAEYTGNTVMRQDYEKNCQSDLSYPFAVCYMGITGVELCVDSSHSDNEAKFIRRSCTPNAKVVHILDKNGLRFFICATKTIPHGKEITIPFYFDYHRSTVEVKCPCGKSNCLVAKYFKDFNSGSTTTTTTTTITTTVVSARPARQIKKKQPDDSGDTVVPSTATTTSSLSSMEQPHEEIKTSSGRVVKPPRNRQTSEHSFTNVTTATSTAISAPSNPSQQSTENPNNISSLLQAHLSGNVDSNKVTKTSSEGSNNSHPLKTASTSDTLAGKTETHGKFETIDKMVSEITTETETEKQVVEKPKKPSHSSRKQQLQPLKQDSKKDGEKNLNKDNKEKKKFNNAAAAEDDNDDDDDDDDKNEESRDDNNDNNKMKMSKKKNSKLLAEIQTSLKIDEKEPEDKKTREQRKIEAAEKRFEKIEQAKNNQTASKATASKSVASTSKTRLAHKENTSTSNKLAEAKKTIAKPPKAAITTPSKAKIALQKKYNKTSANKQQTDKTKKTKAATTTSNTTTPTTSSTSVPTSMSSRSTRSSKR